MNKAVLNLNEIISQLLWKEECVIVPQLGAFIGRDHKTALNPVTHTYKPDNKSIFFNPNIEKTDGMLANYITENFGLSYADANKWISKEVEEIKNKINQGERIEWSNLGSFFGSNDKLFFIPNNNANFNKASFGLPTIQISPVVQSTEQKESIQTKQPLEEIKAKERDYSKTALTPEIDQPNEIKPAKTIGKKKVFLWAAAAVLALAVTVIGFNNENKTYTTNSATALTFDPIQSGVVEDNVAEEFLESSDLSQDETDLTEETPYTPAETEIEKEKTPEATTEINNLTEEDNNTGTVFAEDQEIITESYANEDNLNPQNLWNEENQFHIIIYHSLIEQHIEAFINQNTDGNRLFLGNSLIYRISVASSNNQTELESTLWEVQKNYPNAYILDKSKYKNL